MDTTKLTREEALRRWNASKENKRKMVEKLENLVRKSCLERTGKEPIGVEVWQQKRCLWLCLCLCNRESCCAEDVTAETERVVSWGFGFPIKF